MYGLNSVYTYVSSPIDPTQVCIELLLNVYICPYFDVGCTYMCTVVNAGHAQL